MNSISNDDNLTNIMAISTNVGSTKQVQIRNASTLSIPNQNLNTNSDVTFNRITNPSYYYQNNTDRTMTFVMDNITIAQVQLVTTNNTPVTIYSLNTVNNKSYTVFAEVTMVDGTTSVAGNAGFMMTRRVTNTSNVLDIGSVENIISRRGNTGTSDLIFTSSGAILNIQVVGINSNNNYWTISLKIIRSP